MKWIIFFTVLVSILALLPILNDVISLHSKDVLNKLWGYAPNQFLFLILPFPLAAYCSFLAFRESLLLSKNIKGNDQIFLWLTHNWPVVIAICVIFASLIAITDYFYTAKVFDRLEPIYAKKSIESADFLRNQIEGLQGEDKQEQKRIELSTKFKEKIKRIKSLSKIDKNDMLNLEPYVYLNLVLDSEVQRKFKLLNPTAHALSVLQLFIGILTGSIALLAVLFVLLLRKNGIDQNLDNAINAIIISVVLFSVYPICYRYFVAEMQFVTKFTSTIRGDIISSIAIIVVAGFVLALDPSRKDLMGYIIKGLPFLFVIGPSVYSTVTGPLSLRPIIGIDANPGLRATLFLVMLAFALIIVTIFWPKVYESNQDVSSKPLNGLKPDGK